MDESLIGPLPSEWSVMPLGVACSLGGGNIQTGPFGSQLHASDYVDDGIPSVMPQNITKDVISTRGIARISVADAERLARYRLKAGDIVYSRRGDVERRALVKSHQAGWLCGTGCLRVRFGDGPVNPVYAYYYLGHPSVRSWVTRHAVGATMLNLNTEILAALPFVLPPKPAQDAIASVLSSFDAKILSNENLVADAEDLVRVTYAPERYSAMVPLEDVAVLRRNTVRPETLGKLPIDHYSIPAFDNDHWPERVQAETVKSIKSLLTPGVVLLSKLNPRIPRVWLPMVLEHVPALASTEFLVLQPANGIDAPDLWAVCSQREFLLDLSTRVTGTSGSHQRVRPDDALAVPVIDPRQVDKSERERSEVLLKRAAFARRESRGLAVFRDTLLPRLLSGQYAVLGGGRPDKDGM
jgi:type I restriction enzyme, S subunit